MKKYLVFGMMVSSLLATAADITVTQTAQTVRVLSASVQAEGQGFPSYRVTATATFSNSCVAPRANEVLKVVQHTNNYEVLNLTLAEMKTNRACPAIYAPVTRTFDLGSYTKPNDGSFDAIYVNGVEAVRLLQ